MLIIHLEFMCTGGIYNTEKEGHSVGSTSSLGSRRNPTRPAEVWKNNTDKQTTNLIINLDHDEWIMSDHSLNKTLSEIGARKLIFASLSLHLHFSTSSSYLGLSIIGLEASRQQGQGRPGMMLMLIENETEFSMFNRASYEAFKLNPEVSLPNLL